MTHLAVDEDEGIYLRHRLFGIWLIGFNARTHTWWHVYENTKRGSARST